MEVSSSSYDSGASASSSERKQPITLWPGISDSPVTAVLWGIRSTIYERILDPALGAPPQTQLLTKTPSQSRTNILYNFSTDSALREQYRNPWNEVTFGKLLEDLDALALAISIKHCSDDDSTTRPLLLVTASVEKIALKKPISVDVDLHISGAVTWVGHSSIEIQLDVTQPATDTAEATDSVVLTANFIFVARDHRTGKAAPVNQLNPESERERFLHEAAEARYILRKSNEMQNRVKRFEPPLSERRRYYGHPESNDEQTPLPSSSIYIKETCLQNSLICQPQQRNIHGRIYGGFLMHRAFELAFSTAYAFSGMTPSFLNVDHVDFVSPVNRGDFLLLKSFVLYTENDDSYQPLIHVEVSAQVTRPECFIHYISSEVSNMFYFTFVVRRDPNAMVGSQMIRKIVMETREEAHRVIKRMDADSFQ